jgi:Protein of unknown function (DUF2934)
LLAIPGIVDYSAAGTRRADPDSNFNTFPSNMAAKKTAKKTTVSASADSVKEAAPVAKKAAKKAAKASPAAKKAAPSDPAPAPKVVVKPTNDAIARAAYLIYRKRVEQGLPGNSQSDWLEAERELTKS